MSIVFVGIDLAKNVFAVCQEQMICPVLSK